MPKFVSEIFSLDVRLAVLEAHCQRTPAQHAFLEAQKHCLFQSPCPLCTPRALAVCALHIPVMRNIYVSDVKPIDENGEVDYGVTLTDCIGVPRLGGFLN